jgi:hypothetical protein
MECSMYELIKIPGIIICRSDGWTHRSASKPEIKQDYDVISCNRMGCKHQHMTSLIGKRIINMMIRLMALSHITLRAAASSKQLVCSRLYTNIYR